MNQHHSIFLSGCRENNLKNFSVTLPKYAITVITGVSGSGKSSLAFATLFAEGQRRYLAHLSFQMKALFKELPKPNLDFAEGLAPTIALSKGIKALYPGGTLATYTDIYELLALLYAAIGKQHSPETGKPLTRYSMQEIVEQILQHSLNKRLQLLAPVKLTYETLSQAIKRLEESGFIRFRIDSNNWMSGDPLPDLPSQNTTLDVVVDRLEIKEQVRQRLADSIETAMDLSQGILKVQEAKQEAIHYFTEIYLCPETGLSFFPLESKDFNFNSPKGACPCCHGIGGYLEIQEELFNHPKLSFKEMVEKNLRYFGQPKGAALFTQFRKQWQILAATQKENRAIDSEVRQDIRQAILWGENPCSDQQGAKEQWLGVIPLMNQLLKGKRKRASALKLPGVIWHTCEVCKGLRLKPQSLACLIAGESISTLCKLTVSQALKKLQNWHFEGKEQKIAKEILPLIVERLELLQKVGLSYLELDRSGPSLSDGEVQRVQLASQIGAKLSGIIYILDEPSLGLHRQDVKNLQLVIKELKALDNTIVMVEHERSLISLADHLIEIGPGAGTHGGQLIFSGSYDELIKSGKSPTGQWLSKKNVLPPAPKQGQSPYQLAITSQPLNNLKKFSLKVPLQRLVVFCGVSGSGKSTLAIDLIGAQIQHALDHALPFFGLQDPKIVQRVIISQKQMDRFSARSIPATYIGIMTPLRQLFAQTRLAKARGYDAARFSLIKQGGRCEVCEGLGTIKVNMQLMPDLFVPCEVCQGKKYNHETLQVTWKEKNFAEVLTLSIEEAALFFADVPMIAAKLQLLQELGLGYLTLGQPFTTLSTGEIQRLKLVADLTTSSLAPTLYILDEPSAGLHFQDIKKLLAIFQKLVEQGHSLFIIEHHLDLIMQADWAIELGPKAGPEGGELIFQGSPKQLLKQKTPTAQVLNHLKDG